MLSTPKKKTKKRKETHKEKEIHVNKCQLSDLDSTLNDPEDSQRPRNKRLNDFLVVFFLIKKLHMRVF